MYEENDLNRLQRCIRLLNILEPGSEDYGRELNRLAAMAMRRRDCTMIEWSNPKYPPKSRDELVFIRYTGRYGNALFRHDVRYGFFDGDGAGWIFESGAQPDEFTVEAWAAVPWENDVIMETIRKE